MHAIALTFRASALVAIGSLALAFLVTTASAQDPRCSKARDKIGCNCAMQNGGWITPDGGWATRRGNAAPNEAFIKCMKSRGRS
jgi:hypothetical protein